jgi:hypothetical protein
MDCWASRAAYRDPKLRDMALQFKDEAESPSSFWIKVKQEKKILGNEALEVILPFANTYFSAPAISKKLAL